MNKSMPTNPFRKFLNTRAGLVTLEVALWLPMVAVIASLATMA